ncbi:MAG TPA: molecular chaperone HtpG [bacterium]|nr:molecular chaperone HtpG [bacterium]HPN42159.1 molecular chaperone HtpG [bacterium]
MSEQDHTSYKFKAEVNQLLDILTHSLYTHRDVFIRELISNAADALDKVRFLSLKGEEIVDPDANLEIRITLDKDKKMFTITDTGIGMSRSELIANIGTIARSGTSEFIKQLAADKDKQGELNLIGRFGVGFYSVFMAGEKVEITTKAAQKDEPAWLWISDGRGSFEIQPVTEPVKRGTTIVVHLRQDAEEFAEKFTIQSAIEKYSNFVPFPIMVDGEQINKITAIWREPKNNLKDEQYNEFFKFIARQQDEPLTRFHLSADVPLQFHALLYVPRTNLELFGFGREDEGVHLFVKRVLIDAHAKDIMPTYLRFVRGIVESDDLPLNISRETLQENPYLFKIKSTLVSKFLTHLQEFAQDEVKYKEFWQQHGRTLKEGYNDYTNREKIAELFRFNSSRCANADELTTLKKYVEGMVEKQEEIYYLSGTSREAVEKNPVMDIFKSKNIEVLYCFDPIDEFVLSGMLDYNKKQFVSADQADLSKLAAIPSTSGAEPAAESQPEETRELDKLARRIKDILGDRVEDVKLSERLVDNPAVLVSSHKGMSGQMEKIMHLYNQNAKLPAKVMEINKKHPMIVQMHKIYQKDVNDPMLSKLAFNLFYSVSLLDGSLQDPHEMAANIQDMLTEACKLYIRE